MSPLGTCGPKTRETELTEAMRFAWVMQTPFGAPVDPLVYMIQATVSGVGLRASRMALNSSSSTLPSALSSLRCKNWISSRVSFMPSMTPFAGSPSYKIHFSFGVFAITRARVGRRSELVKMAGQSGSLREWVSPSTPRVSYAVAMVVEIEAHAWFKSCHGTLLRISK